MLELRGKYNIAKVFTDEIDQSAISQIINLLNQEFIQGSQIRMMPDVHAGAGCTIGTTMTITDKIVPNLVGVDIGCGILCVKLKETDFDWKRLDGVIHTHIPSGFDIRACGVRPFLELKELKIFKQVDSDRAYKSLGTLGDGNHFIEVDKDSSDNLWLLIHTGSRHLGTEVCKYYQDLAWRKIKSAGIEKKIQETIEKLKKEGKQKDIENAVKIIKSQAGPIQKELCYLEGSDFDDYIHDMKIVQKFASVNRHAIAEILVDIMKWRPIEIIHTIHNYIDTENMILRKGAVSAEEGERLVIPMNMRDGSLICVGNGNPDWNCSDPHGAGRLMSRSEAKSKISMEDFEDSMKGINTTSVNQSTLDECPMAYKSMDSIVENIGETVEIVDIIKPVYNFKASGD